jgi:hypothetical protein
VPNNYVKSYKKYFIMMESGKRVVFFYIQPSEKHALYSVVISHKKRKKCHDFHSLSYAVLNS